MGVSTEAGVPCRNAEAPGQTGGQAVGSWREGLQSGFSAGHSLEIAQSLLGLFAGIIVHGYGDVCLSVTSANIPHSCGVAVLSMSDLPSPLM